MSEPENIEQTLAQRGTAYGDFREQGRITQNLKRAMQDSPNWADLPSYMREGLDMVVHKIARMLNGDAFYDDNMHDMIGYTKLMQDRAKQDRDRGWLWKRIADPVYPTYNHEPKHGPEEEEPAVLKSDGSNRSPAFLRDGVRAFYGADEEKQAVAGKRPPDRHRYERLICMFAENGNTHFHVVGPKKLVFKRDDIEKLVNEGTVQLYSTPQDLTSMRGYYHLGSMPVAFTKTPNWSGKS